MTGVTELLINFFCVSKAGKSNIKWSNVKFYMIFIQEYQQIMFLSKNVVYMKQTSLTGILLKMKNKRFRYPGDDLHFNFTK